MRFERQSGSVDSGPLLEDTAMSSNGSLVSEKPIASVFRCAQNMNVAYSSGSLMTTYKVHGVTSQRITL